MTYDEYCEHIAGLAEQGLAAFDHDDDAALLCVAAIVDYMLRYGPEVHRDLNLPPVNWDNLRKIKHGIWPIVDIIAQRLSPPTLQ
jgi:hypothetical protein